MTPRQALTTGFEQWLEHRLGAAVPLSKITPGQTLWPYGTSFRDSKQASRRLTAIEHAQPLSGKRPEQVFIDFRSCGLVEESRPDRLSRLGERALAEWRRLGVDNDDQAHEVVRSAVLCRQALLMGVDAYRERFRFWIALRQVRAPAAWFADPEGLVLVTYLNADDPRGYNPFKVLAALGGDFPDFADWQAWAASMTTPAGWPSSRLALLLRPVVGLATRSFGSVTYCRAMEAVYLAHTTPGLLRETAPALAVA